MNERIKELIEQATTILEPNDLDYRQEIFNKEKFAELLIKECTRNCQQEWYDLNNASVENETARDIAFRVGQKAGVIKCINNIRNHFEVV